MKQAKKHRKKAIEADEARGKGASAETQQKKLKITMEDALFSEQNCIGLTGFDRKSLIDLKSLVSVILAQRSESGTHF